ncbi:hypothetical protein ACFYW9_19360 [Streptomyces sp. NPDC002698]|uniref:hypothetical protein n=1 Tax=Streptomyces sp. NPDC002698 TaxID=3364660 RepID=UPI00367EAE78
MSKLPDNDKLRKLFREGRSDVEIAAEYGVTYQAVNKRLAAMGLERRPWANAATAILEAGWPSTRESRRKAYTDLQRGRQLYAFMRWRLGDPGLSAAQTRLAENLVKYERAHDVVISLDPEAETPWSWVPREASDKNLVIRWPAGREVPVGPYRKAITLPEV